LRTTSRGLFVLEKHRLPGGQASLDQRQTRHTNSSYQITQTRRRPPAHYFVPLCTTAQCRTVSTRDKWLLRPIVIVSPATR